ncbi:MAG: hypothetical protein M0R22_03080 [Dehalococcoidia bacterium]|jgi:hypothetical protein|nr:hypothetical protein [Dehalococcoidia bacterium]
MDVFRTIEAARILFASGLLVLVTSVLIMLSCRCVPSKGALSSVRRMSWFQGLFKRHCILWRVFVVVLVVHVVFAVGFLGLPF